MGYSSSIQPIIGGKLFMASTVLDLSKKLELKGRKDRHEVIMERINRDYHPDMTDEEINSYSTPEDYPFTDQEGFELIQGLIVDSVRQNHAKQVAESARVKGEYPLNLHSSDPLDLLKRVRDFIDYSTNIKKSTFDNEAIAVVIERDKDGEPRFKVFASGTTTMKTAVDNAKLIAALNNALIMIQSDLFFEM